MKLRHTKYDIRNIKSRNSKFVIRNSGFKPAYVVKLEIEKNELVVGEEEDLYNKELIAEKVNFLRNTNLAKYEKIKCQAKIRYGHPASPCILMPLSPNNLKVVFQKPQRAITPGQSIVFYDKNQLLGGAIIK